MTERTKPAPHGWLILDKPRGLGSTQAVGMVKRVLRQSGYAKTKVGHGGTLDPLAEGVLPIALGEATKLAGRMLDSEKVYDFTIQFGAETDTLDVEGEVIERTDRRPPMAAITTVLEHFTGPIEQVPPKYSAIKIDGKRAYDRARAGEEVEMNKRAVTVHSLSYSVRPELVEGLSFTSGGAREEKGGASTSSARTDFQLGSSFGTTAGRPDPYDPQAPLELAETVTLTAHVSKGTYIRSLARDIARALGSLGHVTYLRRTKAGPFTEAMAVSPEQLEAEGLENFVLPLAAGLDGIAQIEVDPTQALELGQGKKLQASEEWPEMFCATHRSTPIALVETNAGIAKVIRGFNLPS